MDSEAISAKSVAELRQEREQEHRKEDEEYHKDIEAIERVTRMLAGRKRASVATGIAGADQSKTPVQSGSNNKSGCSPSKAVRASIGALPEKFTIIHVRKYLSDHFPDVDQSAASLSPTLRRLVGDKIIEVNQLGSGSKPTEYRKLSNQPK